MTEDRYPSYRGRWIRPPLESALPHAIIDAAGLVVAVYKSKSAATRELNRCIRRYDKRRRGDSDDPRKWTVQPVRE